jgi:glyceraldehyde 3-phosphate dehydrogenase
MPLRIGINGFGRIGRMACRAALAHKQIEVAAINDLVPTDNLAYLFAHDTVHGRFDGTVEVTGGDLTVAGNRIKCFAERDPAELDWKNVNVDYVVESTGFFTERDKAILHVEKAGARRVVISAPTKTPQTVPTFVMGVNENKFDPDHDAHQVVSNASCTTNCLAPIAKVLHDFVGIKEGLMTTVHAATATQPTQDGPAKKDDFRGGRNAYMNIIPSGTGAATAVALVLPDLHKKLTGMAFRVPTANVSVVDLTVRTEKTTTYKAICAEMRKAAKGPLKGILGYTEEQVVSSDFIGDAHSSIFDAGAGMGLNDRFFKVVSWYDNEWGYSNRVVDLLLHMAATEGLIPQANRDMATATA